jgi:hypothetical protein
VSVLDVSCSLFKNNSRTKRVTNAYPSDINCKGGSLVIPAAPGGFVGAIPAKYNDQITSLACYV